MENKKDLTAWDVVSQVLKLVADNVKVGITTLELNEIGHKEILRLGGIPVNLGYHPSFASTPFPYAMCIGCNESIAHGIASSYALREGDLVSLDVGVKKNGVCGDGALTVGVGEISRKDRKLLDCAKACLYAGIMAVKADVEIKDVSYAIHSTALKHGFVTNVLMSGHGIGSEMHMSPTIPNCFTPSISGILHEGEMICIEPMVTKSDKVGVFLNDWCLVTSNGDKSAVMEHQLRVTKTGCDILTTHI